MRNKNIVMTMALALLLSAASAMADPSPKQNSAQLHKLSAELWEKMLSIPASTNPATDTTGQYCMVGQDGSVWFLVGGFTSGPIIRSCSIPEGVSLYFPVVNYLSYNTPNLCGQVGSLTAQQQRATCKKIIDTATGLLVEVDGKPVKKLSRVQSDVYTVAQPADNVFVSLCGGPSQSPAGIFSPGVDDGYYVLLKPLSVGPHTLHFKGTVTATAFSLDVTYKLMVMPVSTK